MPIRQLHGTGEDAISDPPPYQGGHTDSTAEADGTTEVVWSPIESIGPDAGFSEFPSEVADNIVVRTTARYLSRTEELSSRLWSALCGMARRQGAFVAATRRGSVVLLSACSFVVGAITGGGIVSMSNRSTNTATVRSAAPPVSASERSNVLIETAAVAAPARVPAHADVELVAPARPLATAARRAAFRGALAVYSRPSGARVFVNGRGAGTTPLVLKNQNVGSRAVRIEMDGYEPWTSAVRVVSNASTNVQALLKATRVP
jgi:hypothetical protein